MATSHKPREARKKESRKEVAATRKLLFALAGHCDDDDDDVVITVIKSVADTLQLALIGIVDDIHKQEGILVVKLPHPVRNG